MNALATMTPVAIDTALSDLMSRRARSQYRYDFTIAKLRPCVSGSRDMTEGQVLAAAREISWLSRDVERADQEAGNVACLTEQISPYETEFERRGGWTRAFLSTNADGHVHKGTDCSTCNRGKRPTEFQWMTDYSGAAEETIVASAGWRACTVCYPGAPVGVTHTSMFSDAERSSAAARESRRAAADERARKRQAASLTSDGSPLSVAYRDGREQERVEQFATERAATIWITDLIADDLRWQSSIQPGTAQAASQVAQAIATKHGRDLDIVLADLHERARKKNR